MHITLCFTFLWSKINYNADACVPENLRCTANTIVFRNTTLSVLHDVCGVWDTCDSLVLIIFVVKGMTHVCRHQHMHPHTTHYCTLHTVWSHKHASPRLPSCQTYCVIILWDLWIVMDFISYASHVRKYLITTCSMTSILSYFIHVFMTHTHNGKNVFTSQNKCRVSMTEIILQYITIADAHQHHGCDKSVFSWLNVPFSMQIYLVRWIKILLRFTLFFCNRVMNCKLSVHAFYMWNTHRRREIWL